MMDDEIGNSLPFVFLWGKRIEKKYVFLIILWKIY